MTEFKTGDVVRFKRMPRNGFGKIACTEDEWDHVKRKTFTLGLEFEYIRINCGVIGYDVADQKIGNLGWGWVRADDIEHVRKETWLISVMKNLLAAIGNLSFTLKSRLQSA